MTRQQRIAPAPLRALTGLLVLAAASAPAFAQQGRTYTLDADFDEGVLANVNHTVVHDQLQLDVSPAAAMLPFCSVSATGRNTMVRFDANTGTILGEYRTAPNGLSRNPSRTSVDQFGNVWVGNRDEASGGLGSVVKIGIVVGGTRVDANGTPNPMGLFLKPPFQYSTCVDRDGDGLIRTSRGLLDVLAWPNITDGAGGPDGIVMDALDECILLYQRTSGVQVRHVSVDVNNDVWVGGYPNFPTAFNKLSGVNGAILSTFVAPGCGGHGGVIDNNGVLWSVSLNEDSVMRFDTTLGTSSCIPVLRPHGLNIDTNGFIWIAQFDLNSVTKIAPNGTIVPGFPKRSGGASFDRSLAITPVDNDVWVGSSGGNDVSRLDNTGAQRTVIQLGPNGNSPRGVSVDANGKVWVTNFGSDNAMRIDPNIGPGGLGAVDLTVPLGANAAPYNFSDFTGSVPLATVQPNGSWTVIFNSGVQNTQYGTISYNAAVPANTSLPVSFRAANTIGGLPGLPFIPVVNGQPFTGVFGQFVEIKVEFLRANPSITASPVLFDLTITPIVPANECPASQRFPSSLLVYPEFDNRNGDMTLLTVTNTADNDRDVKVEFVYIGREGLEGQELNCLEFNRTERLTPNDTLSFITKVRDPNQNRGYVYAFAKDVNTGQPIVHNFLIGHSLIIDGIDQIQYSNNPVSFLGIGPNGTPTDHDGDGIRDLNGIEYGCAPDEILVPRFFGQVRSGAGHLGAGNPVVSELVLINLTGGTQFTATLDFLVFNDNEEQFSAQTSFQCWTKRPLLDISNVFANDFLLNATNQNPNEDLGLETGWFRIDGLVANSAARSFDDPAFLALLVERAGAAGASDLPFELGSQANGDLLPRGVLGDTTP